MRIRLNAFGQIEPATVPAPPPNITLGQYFMMAVAAGVTVWIITRWLDGGRR